jgi:N-acetyltransferase
MDGPSLTQRLEGSIVVLEPLEESHREPLRAVAQDAEIWRWLPYGGDGPSHFAQWFEDALAEHQAGREGAFATVERATGKPIGSSRYLNVVPEHRRLEIGWTWLAPSAWGSGANVEAKLLMLEHAFERLGAARVEFKTDARNERSRRALAALPAEFEGVLRRHMVVPGVGPRDSAYFSVIEDEWPGVRADLERRLAARER